jgi:predicted transcriptional regulator
VEGVWKDASLLYWANDAIKEIAMRTKRTRDWQYSTAVVGEDSYTLPENSLDVISVFFGDADGRRSQLERIDFQDFNNLPADGNSGRPQFYTIDDDTLYIWPAPDTAGEISFFRYYIPQVVAGTEDETMPFDGRYDAALGLYVKARAFEQIGDYQQADAMLGRYEQAVDRAAAQEGMEAQAGRAVQPREVW